MSEVEKMYKNSGMRPNYIDACTVEDKYWQNEELANKYGTFDMYMNAKCGHQEDCTTLCSCAYTKEEYPPFTADKQLSLIKWLAGFWVHINDVGGQINISTGGGYVSYYAENLADAIALCINSKWNNLTEQERTEIAEILKG